MIPDKQDRAVEELTTYLNHQVATPIFAFASQIKIFVEDLRDLEIARLKQVEKKRIDALINNLSSSNTQIKEVAYKIQGIRKLLKDKADTYSYDRIIKEIAEVYIPELEAVQRNIQTYHKLGSPELDSGLRKTFDLCRRLGNHVLRMLRNVHASSTDITVKLSSLSFENIILLANSIAQELHEAEDFSLSKRIEVDSQPQVNQQKFGDYDRLIEVFVNMIDNSLKHGIKRPLAIQIDIRIVDPPTIREHFYLVNRSVDEFILIEFSHDVTPINKAYWSSVFEKGFRGELDVSKNSSVTSLGYGLYYCRKVIEAHYGKIKYSDSSIFVGNRGSYLFYIPFYKSKEQFSVISEGPIFE